jgi:hypothetical protein
MRKLFLSFLLAVTAIAASIVPAGAIFIPPTP